ncbi:M50 family metallopeptidase [Staphylococcus gallinarum]|uniref:M50 family metallopeptidase n=1 Tax=Staphylococcus gallinarum TaxID=1293 RepID=UPI0039EF99A2
MLFHYINHYLSLISNLVFKPYLLITITILFILFHYLRNIKLLNYISIVFSFFPVLIHELGHAFAAQIFGGKVHDIHMVITPNSQKRTGQQGYALTSSNSRISEILVTFFGYISAPLMLYLGCFLIFKNLSFLFILICLFFLIFYLFHTKQKWIPLLLILIIIYSVYTLFWSHNEQFLSTINLVYNILLGLLLGESIQSIITTAKVNFKDKNSQWDGAILKQLTLIPSTFWWLLWSSFSIYVIYQTFLLTII